MKKLFGVESLIISIIAFALLSCGGETNKTTHTDEAQALMNRLINDSISVDEMVEIMNGSVLDSLTFEQKKNFIIQLATSHGWEIDSTYDENERDSLFHHTNITDYIRLIRFSEE